MSEIKKYLNPRVINTQLGGVRVAFAYDGEYFNYELNTLKENSAIELEQNDVGIYVLSLRVEDRKCVLLKTETERNAKEAHHKLSTDWLDFLLSPSTNSPKMQLWKKATVATGIGVTLFAIGFSSFTLHRINNINERLNWEEHETCFLDSHIDQAELKRENGLDPRIEPLETPNISALEHVTATKAVSEVDPLIEPVFESLLPPLTTTGYLSELANKNLRILSTVNSIPFGDLHKEGNTPYLVFSDVGKSKLNTLFASTEAKGHTGILVPTGYLEQNGDEQLLNLTRIVAAYCAKSAEATRTADILNLEKFDQESFDLTTGGRAQAHASKSEKCDWETALSNFSMLWEIADSEGLGNQAFPLVIAPSGAIYHIKNDRQVDTSTLIDWLENNKG